LFSKKDKFVLLKPGTLWARTTEQTRQALKCGALESIATEPYFIQDQGINFLVRVLANLVRKDAAQPQPSAASGQTFNPFLPYEQDLFVANISPTHLCLLNKYNVALHHLLLITRDFHEQETPLTLEDFSALWTCMVEFDILAFYNAGKLAGASQRHKHLQLVPLPLVSSGSIPGRESRSETAIPIAALLPTAEFGSDGIGSIPDLPFIHALSWLEVNPTAPVTEVAVQLLMQYQALCSRVGMTLEPTATSASQAYNLLMTRQWMLVVPRRQDCFEQIAVNALGFAGALLVRNLEQMEHLQAIRPMNLLRGVAFER
jgi:sulfate adenylyltransferase (ADP) / ATP adenylyltransferase